jgi:hypothetical protein
VAILNAIRGSKAQFGVTPQKTERQNLFSMTFV